MKTKELAHKKKNGKKNKVEGFFLHGFKIYYK